LNTAPIELAAHRRWFEARLARDDSHLFVLLAHDLPVGQIRFDVSDGVALIDYSLDHCVRGRGWGRELIERGVRAMPHGVAFRGDVKPGNAASAAAFARAGFVERTERTNDGLRVFEHGSHA
jgi:spore coat polysaccharide biosynthesis protein SpsF